MMSQHWERRRQHRPAGEKILHRRGESLDWVAFFLEACWRQQVAGWRFPWGLLPSWGTCPWEPSVVCHLQSEALYYWCVPLRTWGLLRTLLLLGLPCRVPEAGCGGGSPGHPSHDACPCHPPGAAHACRGRSGAHYEGRGRPSPREDLCLGTGFQWPALAEQAWQGVGHPVEKVWMVSSQCFVDGCYQDWQVPEAPPKKMYERLHSQMGKSENWEWRLTG